MFATLFGADKKKTAAPVVNVTAANEKLNGQIENIEMRIKKLENDQQAHKKLAVEKARKGDKKGGALMLRKAKMVEAELVKLEGQSIILEKQKQMIENSKFDKEVFEAMKAGKQAVDANKQDIDIDELENIKDDIAEQMADAEEVQDFFA